MKLTLRRVATGADARTRELLERLERLDPEGASAASVLALSEFQLMHMLDVSLADARKVVQAVALALTPRIVPAAQLDAMQTTIPSPLSVVRLQPGHVIEVVGRAGVGKTQMCLSCAVDAVLGPAAQSGRGCVYVDTENKFSAERVLEIVHSKYKGAASAEAIKCAIEKIIVFSPQSAQQLVALFEGPVMEKTLLEQNTGLVVLDSIASLIKYDHHSSKGYVFKRHNMLSKLAARLKLVAETCRIPILVSNQVQGQHKIADESSLANPNQFGNAAPQQKPLQSSSSVQAALGNTWSHAINVRITFETLHQEENDENDRTNRRWLRKARVAKAPGQPELECIFRITNGGIEQVEQTEQQIR